MGSCALAFWCQEQKTTRHELVLGSGPQCGGFAGTRGPVCGKGPGSGEGPLQRAHGTQDVAAHPGGSRAGPAGPGAGLPREGGRSQAPWALRPSCCWQERGVCSGSPGEEGLGLELLYFPARVPRPTKGPRTCFRAWDLRFKLGQAHGGDCGLLMPHLTTTPGTGLWAKCPDLVRLAGDGHCVPLLTRVTPRASVSPLQSEGGRVESGSSLTCLPGMGSSQTCAGCRYSGCLGPK